MFCQKTLNLFNGQSVSEVSFSIGSGVGTFGTSIGNGFPVESVLPDNESDGEMPPESPPQF
jgi:hypothetical protein